MAAFIFIFLFLFTSIILDIEAFEANCPIVKCKNGTADIRFPFRVDRQQPFHCGYPGFELVCKENNTIVQFPSYRDLVVKTISYDIKKLTLIDPKNCVHEVFLNLNLSLTPFQYYYVVKNYTYLNCSAKLSPSFMQIPCLSGLGYHVYTVESSLPMPVSCRLVKTIAIPFSYSPYLSDNSFGLGLTWDLPAYEAKGSQCRFQPKRGHETRCPGVAHDHEGFSTKHLVVVLSISIFIFAAAKLACTKISHSKKLNGQKEKESHLKTEKLLGDL